MFDTIITVSLLILPDICVMYSRFTCRKIAVHSTGSFQAVLFFSADSSRKKDFQPVKNHYFCIGQQKKRTSKTNRYFGTCKLANRWLSYFCLGKMLPNDAL